MRIFLAFLLFSPALFADNWKYEQSGDGVIAYTRAVPDSNFKEYKVETEVTGTLSQVTAVLMSVKDLPQWVDRCSEAAILKEISPTESIARTVTASPFPLKDREAIAHGKLYQDPQSKVVILISSGRPDFVPRNPKFERVTKLRGKWILTPKKGGKIFIQMIGHTDPGGVIPAAVANHFVVRIPFATIKNLRKQILKPQYVHAKLSYIKD